MPDCNPSDPTQKPGWQDRLGAGDTVSFRFPVAEEGGPRPKARPCLVLDVTEIGGVRHALLAYGTSRRNAANLGLEVEVRGVAARAAAGLDRRTRFVGARRVAVPVGDPAFVVCAALDTPILGTLAEAEMARLEMLRARYGADLGGTPPADVPPPPRAVRREDARPGRIWPATGRRRDPRRGFVPVAPVERGEPA